MLHNPCSAAAPVDSDSPLGQGMLNTTKSCEQAKNTSTMLDKLQCI